MDAGRTLVLGGARSGKSDFAAALLPADTEVRYVATGYPPGDDPEWAERVRRHRAARPASWRTVETEQVAAELRGGASPVLLDCVSLWLTRRMDAHAAFTGPSPPALAADVAELVAAWRSCAVPAVAVSNEVGSGVIPATPAGRRFADELGALNRALAAAADAVWLLVAGLPLRLK